MKQNRIKVRACGADIGNNSTKTSQGICFPSKVTRGEHLDRNSLAIKVKWRGEFFIIGDSTDAMQFKDVNKVYSDEYKICLLTSIGLSYPDGIINTVVGIGLPYDEWGNSRFKYKEEIEKLKDEEITIYLDSDDTVGIKKYINIERCIVSAEGSIEDFISDDELPCMVVDFGGRTLDLTTYVLSRVYENNEYKNKLAINGTTDTSLSFDDVLHKIKNELHEKGYTVKTDQELIAILQNDELKTFGSTINLKRIRDKHMNIYCHKAIQHLRNNQLEKFPYVKFIGGCSEIVLEYIAKILNLPEGTIDILPNSQFFNAINFGQQAIKCIDAGEYEILSDEY